MDSGDMGATPVPLRAVPDVVTDIDKAKQYKTLVENMMRDVCLCVDAAKREGLVVNIGVSPDAFGRSMCSVNVVKPLA